MTCEVVKRLDYADAIASSALSYARQARDNTLYETAQKIHGRAIKRVGGLLAAIEAQQGQRNDREPRTGAHTKFVPGEYYCAACNEGIARQVQRLAPGRGQR